MNNYVLRMALLDRIRGWFYYVFIRGKDKRSEDNLSKLSIIGDTQIRSSPKHSCLLTVTTFLPEKALKKLEAFIPKQDKNKRILALLKVCYSSLHCLFTLGRVMSLQIRYFAVNVTQIH